MRIVYATMYIVATRLYCICISMRFMLYEVIGVIGRKCREMRIGSGDPKSSVGIPGMRVLSCSQTLCCGMNKRMGVAICLLQLSASCR